MLSKLIHFHVWTSRWKQWLILLLIQLFQVPAGSGDIGENPTEFSYSSFSSSKGYGYTWFISVCWLCQTVMHLKSQDISLRWKPLQQFAHSTTRNISESILAKNIYIFQQVVVSVRSGKVDSSFDKRMRVTKQRQARENKCHATSLWSCLLVIGPFSW